MVDLAPGAIFASDFRIVRPLSEGGMGSVYVVDQLSTGAQRALKLMKRELVADQTMQARFLQEARASARIASDHVVQVISAGVEAGTPWLVMELLVGEELDQRVKKRGPLPRGEVAEVLRQLTHALAAAHAVGIVHRDLKPNNIFLATSRTAGAPFALKILDFGIAKIIEDAQASSTMAIGTPLWMAPEQTEQRGRVSASTDIWAVGLITFYLLTGRVYWMSAAQAQTSMQTLLREMLVEPIVPPSRRAAELGVGHLVPPGFDAWFMRLVERDPERRENDMRRALAALEPILAGGAQSAAFPVSAVASSAPPQAPYGSQAAPQAYGAPSGAYPAGASSGQTPYGASGAAPAWTAAPTAAPVMHTPPIHAGPSRRSAVGLIAAGIGALVLAGGGATAYVLSTSSSSTKKKSHARSSDDDDDDASKKASNDDDDENQAEADRAADCAAFQVFSGRVAGTVAGMGEINPDPPALERTATLMDGLSTQARALALRTDAAQSLRERLAKTLDDTATSLRTVATAIRTQNQASAQVEAQKLQALQTEFSAIDQAGAELCPGVKFE